MRRTLTIVGIATAAAVEIGVIRTTVWVQQIPTMTIIIITITTVTVIVAAAEIAVIKQPVSPRSAETNRKAMMATATIIIIMKFDVVIIGDEILITTITVIIVVMMIAVVIATVIVIIITIATTMITMTTATMGTVDIIGAVTTWITKMALIGTITHSTEAIEDDMVIGTAMDMAMAMVTAMAMEMEMETIMETMETEMAMDTVVMVMVEVAAMVEVKIIDANIPISAKRIGPHMLIRIYTNKSCLMSSPLVTRRKHSHLFLADYYVSSSTKKLNQLIGWMIKRSLQS